MITNIYDDYKRCVLNMYKDYLCSSMHDICDSAILFLCYCSNNEKYRSALCSDRCCTRCWSLCCYQPYRLRLSWYELTHFCSSTLQASVRISVRLVDAATLMALPPPASTPNLVRSTSQRFTLFTVATLMLVSSTTFTSSSTVTSILSSLPFTMYSK